MLASGAFDYWRLLSFIAVAAERSRCAVHALALMSNHLHIIVTPPDAESLPRFVHGFAHRYAVFRNQRRRGTGKLFEERYRSFLLGGDEALAAVAVVRRTRTRLALSPLI